MMFMRTDKVVSAQVDCIYLEKGKKLRRGFAERKSAVDRF